MYCSFYLLFVQQRFCNDLWSSALLLFSSSDIFCSLLCSFTKHILTYKLTIYMAWLLSGYFKENKELICLFSWNTDSCFCFCFVYQNYHIDILSSVLNFHVALIVILLILSLLSNFHSVSSMAVTFFSQQVMKDVFTAVYCHVLF